MAERTLVVDHLKLRYEGLFSVAELFNLIGTFFVESGWGWQEPLNQEEVTPDGKQVYIIMEPDKSVSDFYKMQMRIKIIGTDLHEMEVEHDQQKLLLDHGVLHITFDGYLLADRKNKYQKKPWRWFLGLVFSKYFFYDHEKKFENWLEEEVATLHDAIKKYLNMVNYTYKLRENGPTL